MAVNKKENSEIFFYNMLKTLYGSVFFLTSESHHEQFLTN